MRHGASDGIHPRTDAAPDPSRGRSISPSQGATETENKANTSPDREVQPLKHTHTHTTPFSPWELSIHPSMQKQLYYPEVQDIRSYIPKYTRAETCRYAVS